MMKKDFYLTSSSVVAFVNSASRLSLAAASFCVPSDSAEPSIFICVWLTLIFPISDFAGFIFIQYIQG